MILKVFLLALGFMSYLHKYHLFLGTVSFVTLLVLPDIVISYFGLYNPSYDEPEAWLCNVCHHFLTI